MNENVGYIVTPYCSGHLRWMMPFCNTSLALCNNV